jgi:hypothetical protein
VVPIYTGKTGKRPETIVKLMDGKDGADGTWFTAQEAKDEGFIDTIVNPTSRSKMKFDARVFGALPAWVAERVKDAEPAQWRRAAAKRRLAIDEAAAA